MVETSRVWDIDERLISFGVLVSRIVESLPPTRIGKHVSGQLLRCGTAPAPIHAEAQSAESRKDFIHKMRLCLKELREVFVWLRYARRLELGDSQVLEEGLEETDQLIRIFAASIATAERNQKKRS